MKIFKKNSFVLDDRPFDLQSLEPYSRLKKAVERFLFSKIKKIRIVKMKKRGGKK